MLAKLLLLLAAASALGRGNTLATATSAAACEDNNNYRFDGCNNNDNNNNVIMTLQEQQHQQQRQHQHDTQRQQQQQHTTQMRLKSQQQQQKELQQHEEKPQFDPFDFANLRRLQQINEYYDDSNNNNKLQQQQQQKRDQDSTYSSDNNNGNIKNSGNNGSNYFYKHDTNYNNNENPSSSSNSRSHSHNYSRTPSPPSPDASNDFRLQLSSALNVGSSSRSGSSSGAHVANTKRNSNNNYNDKNYNDESNDSGDQQQQPPPPRHSVAVRSKSFAEADHTSAAVPFGMDAYYGRADAQEADEPNAMVDDDVDVAADEDDELGMQLPYGIQNVRKRTIRGSPPSEHRGKSTTYQSLCPTKRVSIPLETVGFEYRPNHYIEVTCAHNYAPTHNYDFNKNKICSEAGFSCIQLNRTIHLIRRNKAAVEECWESEIRIVPSGCECMWPKHSYGDIIAYHEAHKRYSPQAHTNARPPTEGGASSLPSFLQVPRRVELIGLDGQRREETEGIGFEAYEFN